MTFEEYLSNMKPGYTVDGGSEDHLIMHEMSQRALKITMELNNKYHTKEEIVQLALPYEILLQHASIVSCSFVLRLFHILKTSFFERKRYKILYRLSILPEDWDVCTEG